MCLALDLANTACAGHFNDSVHMNLAAVLIRLKKQKNKGIRGVIDKFENFLNYVNTVEVLTNKVHSFSK